MKHQAKGPKDKVRPEDRKENTYKGAAGKNQEPRRKDQDTDSAADSGDWEYPAESSYNSGSDALNTRAGSYKHDSFSKGPDEDDDDDDVYERDHENPNDDEEF